MKLSCFAMGVCSALLATSALASNYEPYVVSGKTIYLSGQIPLENGQVMFPGQLGGAVSVEDGISAAEWVVNGLLAQLQTAAGSFDNIKQCNAMNVFVNSTPDFTEHKMIANAASDAWLEALGDKGRHTRTTVGVPSLPMNAPLEINIICSLR